MGETSDNIFETKVNENYKKYIAKLQSLDGRCDENRILDQSLKFCNLSHGELVCVVISVIMVSIFNQKRVS